MAPSFQIAAGLLVALVAAGCESLGPGRVELSGGELTRLRAEARPPAEMGLLIDASASGFTSLRGIYSVPPRGTAEIRTVRHPGSASLHPVIPVRVNGHALLAAVDTGASMSLVSLDAQRRAGVRPIGPDLLSLPTVTFSGRRSTVLGVASDLFLGDLGVERVPFGIVRRLPGIPLGVGGEMAQVDVLLGQDLLRRFGAVVFEPRRRMVVFHGPASAYVPPPSRVRGSVDFELSDHWLPVFMASIGGTDPVPVAFDSGGGFGLWIPEPVASAANLADAGTPVELQLARALFKPSISRPVRPSTIRLGDYVTPPLPAYIGMIAGGEHDPGFALLGNRILATTAVAIDYRNRRIYFLGP